MARPAGTQAMDPLSLAELQQLQAQANLRRQSTANTSHLLGAVGAPDPAALFAAATAEGAAVAAAAAAALAVQQPVPAARRLSVVGGTDGGSSSWSQEEGESEESPEFTLRRTTARTAGAAPPVAPAAAAAVAAAAAAGLALPPAQHHYLQPPAAAPSREQQVPTPAQAGATPAVQSVVLPEALLPLRLDLPVAPAAGAVGGQSPGEVRCSSCFCCAAPGAGLTVVVLCTALGCDASVCSQRTRIDASQHCETLWLTLFDRKPAAPLFKPSPQEDSPALTQNAAPHAAAAAAATADLLSPLRSQLPPAPPLFTPSSSGAWGTVLHVGGRWLDLHACLLLCVDVQQQCMHLWSCLASALRAMLPSCRHPPSAACAPIASLPCSLSGCLRRAQAHRGLSHGGFWPLPAAAGHPRLCCRDRHQE